MFVLTISEDNVKCKMINIIYRLIVVHSMYIAYFLLNVCM